MKMFTLFRISLLIGLFFLLCCPSPAATKAHAAPVRHTKAVKNARIVPGQHTATVKKDRKLAAERQMRRYQHSVSRKQNAAALRKTSPSTARTTIAGAKRAQNLPGVIFFDDMESGINGWAIDTHQDTLWHLTERDFNSPAHSWWLGNENTGTYSTGKPIDQSIVSPPIDLTGIAAPVKLQFSEFYVVEPQWDDCMVDITSDGGATWQTISSLADRSEYGNAYSDGWVQTNLNLDAFANNTINIRFHFSTGDTLYNEFPGWFIDNVMVLSQWGTISGTNFYDVNQNGIRDNGDGTLNGWVVTATAPGITLTTRTDESGNYRFTLPPGTYTIAESLQTQWTQTAPVSGSWTIDLNTPGTVATGNNFGNWRVGGQISGFMFIDINKNGVRDGADPSIAGQEVDMDLVSTYNEYYEVRYTDSLGRFTFALYDTGTCHIDQNSDYRQTYPYNNASYKIQISDINTTYPDVVFGVYKQLPLARISGHIFIDLNENGMRDTNETGYPNLTVYLDGDDYREFITDSNGYYNFSKLYAGTYSVDIYPEEPLRQSFPDHTYQFILADTTLIDTVDFGIYEMKQAGYISGHVFNDANQNGIRDTNEPPLAGVEIILNGDEYQTTFTDNNGYYYFGALWEGDYNVKPVPVNNLMQSTPVYPYSFTVWDTTKIDSADFGFFNVFQTGSIRGQIFNDENGDALKEAGESGLPSWSVTLSGNTHIGTPILLHAVTDTGGYYRFPSLWPGHYTITEEVYTHWVQTVPLNFNPIDVVLAPQGSMTNANFGNYCDSALNAAYRSFIPESLAFTRDIKGNIKWTPIKKLYPCRVAFSTTIKNDGSIGRNAPVLILQFKIPIIDTLVISPWGSQEFDPKRMTCIITFPDGIAEGDSVLITGLAQEAKIGGTTLFSIRSVRWKYPDMFLFSAGQNYTVCSYSYLPPNAVDILNALNTSITVGMPGYHYVVMKKSADVGKSLIYRNQIHTGPPTCLGTKPSTKALSSLSPHTFDDRLFSEALALQMNILTSDARITPRGFGDLIFDEGGENPFNGKSVRFIAGKLNEYMSSNSLTSTPRSHVYITPCTMPAGYEWLDSLRLWQTIRKIDSSFCGPMDFYYWNSAATPTISLKPVRGLFSVPYLHLDSTFSNIGKAQRATAVALPERFELLQNYPNPFNPATTLSFTLPQPATVTLKVYNMLGQLVATVYDKRELAAGVQEADFTAGMLASGVYFYRIDADVKANAEKGIAETHFSSVKKMMFVK
jgi:hypothetical protein